MIGMRIIYHVYASRQDDEGRITDLVRVEVRRWTETSPPVIKSPMGETTITIGTTRDDLVLSEFVVVDGRTRHGTSKDGRPVRGITSTLPVGFTDDQAREVADHKTKIHLAGHPWFDLDGSVRETRKDPETLSPFETPSVQLALDPRTKRPRMCNRCLEMLCWRCPVPEGLRLSEYDVDESPSYGPIEERIDE